MSLAGGRYDPTQQRAYCKKQPTKDFYCDGTLKDDVSAIPAKDATDSFRDPRIKAFYIMGTGPGQGFSEDSLKAIHAPRPKRQRVALGVRGQRDGCSRRLRLRLSWNPKTQRFCSFLTHRPPKRSALAVVCRA